MRQRNLKWADEFLANSELVIKEFPFKLENSNNFLEIGCGKGDFITQKALKEPNNNFIALEINTSCLAISCKKATDLKIENIKFSSLNAIDLLEKFDGKFDGIYLNFSDPWPKARHEKRRLTSPKFLEIYKKILKEDGILTFKTDNVGLYEYSSETIPNYFEVIENTKDYKLTSDDVISEYEAKFRALGNPINKIVVRNKK